MHCEPEPQIWRLKTNKYKSRKHKTMMTNTGANTSPNANARGYMKSTQVAVASSSPAPRSKVAKGSRFGQESIALRAYVRSGSRGDRNRGCDQNNWFEAEP